MASTPKILHPLDEVDQILVCELQVNARITNAELAEIAGIAASTCVARVRNLVQSGVITAFTAEVSPKALGLELEVLISVSLRAGARANLSSFMSEMRALPEVIQVFFLGGSEDFIVHLAVRDSAHVRDFVLQYLSNNPVVASTRTNMVFDHFHKGPMVGNR